MANITELTDNYHIIGLLMDIACSTGMTDKKLAYIKKKMTDLQIRDINDKLCEVCIKEFHGIQPMYLRENSSLEARKKALNLVNEMMASDPDAPVNPLGQSLLQLLPQSLGI